MTAVSSTLLDAAAKAAGDQQYPTGALYVVATPIGNLADLTLRAIHVLALADTVACEDTRVSGALLRRLGLHRPLLALHEHNEARAATKVVGLLRLGQRVAYLSDAGTPAISDPGAALVAAATAARHRVVPIPGPSSAVAALSAAGAPLAEGFRFLGFLPTRTAAREAALRAAAAERATQVLFEAPHRIGSLAQALASHMPDRVVTLARELTKQFETIVTMPAQALPSWLAADAQRTRGEFVLVLHAVAPGQQDPPTAAADAQRVLGLLLPELPLKRAVALAAAITHAPRNALYESALALRGAAAGDSEHDRAS